MSTNLKVGQRVRTTLPLVANNGERVEVGTFADIVAMSGAFLDLTAYVSTGDKSPARHLPVSKVLPDRVSLCRGKPYVHGADPKRRGGEEAASGTTATPTATATAPVGLAERIAEAVAGALSGIGASAPASAEVNAEVSEALGVLEGKVAALECEVSSVLSGVEAVGERVDTLSATLATIAEALSTANPAAKSKVAVALGISSPNPVVEALSRWYAPNVTSAGNLLLCSPPSFGKSYGVREFGRGYDLYLEHGCSDDIDEVPTLLGNPVPDGKGGFIVVDGIITQAVRAASEGRSVLVLLDEVLRLAPRAQEWLLTFLAGYKAADGTRGYRLTTRRATEDGTFEVLHCGADKLHIVAATNLGIVTPVEAFWSRWEKVRFSFSEAATAGISQSVLAAYGFAGTEAESVAKLWGTLVASSRTAVVEGRIAFPCDIRMLERAASHPSNTSCRDVVAALCDRLADCVARWDADLGDIDPVGVTWATDTGLAFRTAFDSLNGY